MKKIIFYYILPICLVVLLIATVFSAVWSRPRSYTDFLGEAENNIEKIVVKNMSIGRVLTLTSVEDFRSAHSAFAGGGRDATYYCYDTDVYWGARMIGTSGYIVTYYRADGSQQGYHVYDDHIRTVPIYWSGRMWVLKVTNYYYAPQSDLSYFEQLDWDNAPAMSLTDL